MTAAQPLALVVEDDFAIREAMCLLLHSAGYHTTAAANLQQAITALIEHEVVVVVLDRMFEGALADDFLSELAVRDHAPPTVLVSASPAAVALAARFGIMFVAKPFDGDVLLAAIDESRRQGRRPRITP